MKYSFMDVGGFEQSLSVARPRPLGSPGFRLVDAEYVGRCLDDPQRTCKTVFLEAHFTSIDHPLDPDRPPGSHIPGAIQVHPSYLEAGLNRKKYYPFYSSPLDGNLLECNDLAGVLERLGITPDSRVVIYGTEPDGAMAAARLAWGLMVAGVSAIRLLDGGIAAWIEHGGTTASSVRTVWQVDENAACLGQRRQPEWKLRPEYLATTEEVRELVRQGGSFTGGRLVDVRRRGEWDGTLTDYYCFYSKAGHIPTAIHQGDWDTLLEPGTQKLGPRLESVAARWRSLGIIDSKVENGNTGLIFYCGTGWRSSIAFLIAHLLGLSAKNYDDGFYGWSWNDTAEVADQALAPGKID